MTVVFPSMLHALRSLQTQDKKECRVFTSAKWVTVQTPEGSAKFPRPWWENLMRMAEEAQKNALRQP